MKYLLLFSLLLLALATNAHVISYPAVAWPEPGAAALKDTRKDTGELPIKVQRVANPVFASEVSVNDPGYVPPLLTDNALNQTDRNAAPSNWTGLIFSVGYLGLRGANADARRLGPMNGNDWLISAGYGWTFPVKRLRGCRLSPELEAVLYSYSILDSSDMVVNLDIRSSLVLGIPITRRGDQGAHLDLGPQLVYAISSRPAYDAKADDQGPPSERRWRLQYQVRISTPVWLEGKHIGEGYLQGIWAPRTIAWKGQWANTWMLQAGIKIRVGKWEEEQTSWSY